MPAMSMNKVIHGAFRRDLDRFVAAVGSLSPGDRRRATELATAWENFDDQLTYHHEGEHEIAWPALQSVGVSPEVLNAMDAEHDVMAKALTDARNAMRSLARTADKDQIATTSAALGKLRTVAVDHMDHEEAEIEGVYLAKRETPEIQAMGKAFAKVSPARGGRFFAWLLDGVSPDERAMISKQVPGPVLKVLTGVFGRGYRKNVAPVWRG